MRLLCQLSYVSMYAAAIDIACRVWRSVEDSNLCDVAADLGLAGQPLTYSGNAPYGPPLAHPREVWRDRFGADGAIRTHRPFRATVFWTVPLPLRSTSAYGGKYRGRTCDNTVNSRVLYLLS